MYRKRFLHLVFVLLLNNIIGNIRANSQLIVSSNEIHTTVGNLVLPEQLNSTSSSNETILGVTPLLPTAIELMPDLDASGAITPNATKRESTRHFQIEPTPATPVSSPSSSTALPNGIIPLRFFVGNETDQEAVSSETISTVHSVDLKAFEEEEANSPRYDPIDPTYDQVLDDYTESENIQENGETSLAEFGDPKINRSSTTPETETKQFSEMKNPDQELVPSSSEVSFDDFDDLTDSSSGQVGEISNSSRNKSEPVGDHYPSYSTGNHPFFRSEWDIPIKPENISTNFEPSYASTHIESFDRVNLVEPTETPLVTNNDSSLYSNEVQIDNSWTDDPEGLPSPNALVAHPEIPQLNENEFAEALKPKNDSESGKQRRLRPGLGSRRVRMKVKKIPRNNGTTLQSVTVADSPRVMTVTSEPPRPRYRSTNALPGPPSPGPSPPTLVPITVKTKSIIESIPYVNVVSPKETPGPQIERPVNLFTDKVSTFYVPSQVYTSTPIALKLRSNETRDWLQSSTTEVKTHHPDDGHVHAKDRDSWEKNYMNLQQNSFYQSSPEVVKGQDTLNSLNQNTGEQQPTTPVAQNIYSHEVHDHKIESDDSFGQRLPNSNVEVTTSMPPQLNFEQGEPVEAHQSQEIEIFPVNGVDQKELYHKTPIPSDQQNILNHMGQEFHRNHYDRSKHRVTQLPNGQHSSEKIYDVLPTTSLPQQNIPVDPTLVKGQSQLQDATHQSHHVFQSKEFFGFGAEKYLHPEGIHNFLPTTNLHPEIPIQGKSKNVAKTEHEEILQNHTPPELFSNTPPSMSYQTGVEKSSLDLHHPIDLTTFPNMHPNSPEFQNNHQNPLDFLGSPGNSEQIQLKPSNVAQFQPNLIYPTPFQVKPPDSTQYHLQSDPAHFQMPQSYPVPLQFDPTQFLTKYQSSSSAFSNYGANSAQLQISNENHPNQFPVANSNPRHFQHPAPFQLPYPNPTQSYQELEKAFYNNLMHSMSDPQRPQRHKLRPSLAHHSPPESSHSPPFFGTEPKSEQQQFTNSNLNLPKGASPSMTLPMPGLVSIPTPPPESHALNAVYSNRHYPPHTHSISVKPDYEPANPPLHKGHPLEHHFDPFLQNAGEFPEDKDSSKIQQFQHTHVGRTNKQYSIEESSQAKLPQYDNSDKPLRSSQDNSGNLVTTQSDNLPRSQYDTSRKKLAGRQVENPEKPSRFQSDISHKSQERAQYGNVNQPPRRFRKPGRNRRRKSHRKPGYQKSQPRFQPNSDEARRHFRSRKLRLGVQLVDSRESPFKIKSISSEHSKSNQSETPSMFSENAYVLMFPNMIPERAMLPARSFINGKQIPVLSASDPAMAEKALGRGVATPGYHIAKVHPREQMLQVLADSHYESEMEKYMEKKRQPPLPIHTPYGLLVPMGLPNPDPTYTTASSPTVPFNFLENEGSYNSQLGGVEGNDPFLGHGDNKWSASHETTSEIMGDVWKGFDDTGEEVEINIDHDHENNFAEVSHSHYQPSYSEPKSVKVPVPPVQANGHQRKIRGGELKTLVKSLLKEHLDELLADMVLGETKNKEKRRIEIINPKRIFNLSELQPSSSVSTSHNFLPPPPPLRQILMRPRQTPLPVTLPSPPKRSGFLGRIGRLFGIGGKPDLHNPHPSGNSTKSRNLWPRLPPLPPASERFQWGSAFLKRQTPKDQDVKRTGFPIKFQPTSHEVKPKDNRPLDKLIKMLFKKAKTKKVQAVHGNNFPEIRTKGALFSNSSAKRPFFPSRSLEDTDWTPLSYYSLHTKYDRRGIETMDQIQAEAKGQQPSYVLPKPSATTESIMDEIHSNSILDFKAYHEFFNNSKTKSSRMDGQPSKFNDNRHNRHC